MMQIIIIISVQCLDDVVGSISGIYVLVMLVLVSIYLFIKNILHA